MPVATLVSLTWAATSARLDASLMYPLTAASTAFACPKTATGSAKSTRKAHKSSLYFTGHSSNERLGKGARQIGPDEFKVCRPQPARVVSGRRHNVKSQRYTRGKYSQNQAFMKVAYQGGLSNFKG